MFTNECVSAMTETTGEFNPKPINSTMCFAVVVSVVVVIICFVINV